MDLRTMEPGRLALVEEVGALLGRNVRVVGRASRLDYANARLLLSHRGASVLVDASLLDKLPFGENGLVMVLGEVAPNSNAGGVMIVARICRSVEGLSIDVWDKAVMLHRGFMKKLQEREDS